MTATVITATGTVRARRSQRNEQLDPRSLRGVVLVPGQRVEVRRQANNPYLVYVGQPVDGFTE